MQTQHDLLGSSDIDRFTLNSLANLRQMILSTQWKETQSNPLTGYVHKEAKGSLGSLGILGINRGVHLDLTAYNIVLLIDNIQEISSLFNSQQMEEQRFRRLISHAVTDIDNLLKSQLAANNPSAAIPAATDYDQLRNEEYQSYRNMLEITSKIGLEMLVTVIETEIQCFRQAHLVLNNTEIWLIRNLEATLEMIHSSLSPDCLSIKNLCTLQEEVFLVHQQFIELLSRDDLKNPKEERFMEKKIKPYLTYLNKNQGVTSEATQDLAIIVKALLREANNPNAANMFTLNGFDEIEITIGKDRYNLTQVLTHEPNFNQIMLTDTELDSYLTYLQSGIQILEPQSFPVPTDGDSKTIMDNLAAHLQSGKKQNNFSNCHAAECLAMNMYTGPSYIVINTFLRSKILSLNLFKDGNANPIVQQALDQIETKLTGCPANKEEITSSERKKLLFEALLATVVAVSGINKAVHLCYIPAEEVSIDLDNKLSTERGRTIRGASGPWTSKEEKLYILALTTGLPIYSSGFTSASFDTKTVGQFAGQDPDALITKALAWSGLLEHSLGTFLREISCFPGEDEYVFPPCIRLPQRRSRIKESSSYGPIVQTEKATILMSNGNSPKSSYYSSVIQKIRMEFIAKYDELAEYDQFAGLVDLQTETIITKSLVSMYRLINTTDTQLKKVKIVAIPDTLSLQHIEPLGFHKRKDTNITILISESGKLFLVDAQTKNIEEAQINQNDMRDMLHLLDLNSSFTSVSQTGDCKEINGLRNYLEIAYISKISGLKIDLCNEPKATLDWVKDQLEKLEENYNIPWKSHFPMLVVSQGFFSSANQAQNQPQTLQTPQKSSGGP